MRLSVRNDLNTWHIAKIRQHTHKIEPTKSAGRKDFEGGFVSSINSVSPNYFDVLSEAEETPLLVMESEFPGLQRATAKSLDPKGKTTMSLRDLEVEASKNEMRLALHFNREEAERIDGGK